MLIPINFVLLFFLYPLFFFWFLADFPGKECWGAWFCCKRSWDLRQVACAIYLRYHISKRQVHTTQMHNNISWRHQSKIELTTDKCLYGRFLCNLFSVDHGIMTYRFRFQLYRGYISQRVYQNFRGSLSFGTVFTVCFRRLH